MAATLRKRSVVHRPVRRITQPHPDPVRMEDQSHLPTSPVLSLTERPVSNDSYRFVTGDESLHAEAIRAAATHFPLLIMGEPGTGKSSLARFIHEQSKRQGGRFVEFNCDATPESPLSAQLFGSVRGRANDSATGERSVICEVQGGTLLISGFEHGAKAMRAELLAWLDTKGEPRLRSDVRLILAADQDIRSHVDRTLWERLVAWPPILLTPLRVQRRKKWSLFGSFVEQAATGQGLESPVTVDFLLYAFIVGYGWPGNARQLKDFACYLAATGALRERDLFLDQEFCFFDTSEAFAGDDALEASRLAQGPHRVYRNRVHRDFARAVGALQCSDSGRTWQELSKASPGRAGQWSYPKIRWSDPHFAGADMCARVGQSYDVALAGLGQWFERIPGRDLMYQPGELPWIPDPRSERVAPGLTRADLAELVAYGLVTGEISGKDELLTRVYEAIVRLAPDLTPKDYQELGIPKARLRSLLSRR